MTKQDLIHHLKHRITYCQEEQGKYESMHGELNAKDGTMHSLWSEMADWHKGRACAYNVALELVEELEAL